MLAIAFAAVLAAAPASSPPEAHPSFGVTVEGHGPPLVFIPGLACGAESYRNVLDHFAAHHTVYAVTLAGFAGQPAVEGELVPRVERELAAYLRAQHAAHVVVVGHSLGGFLAYALALRAPDLVEKVVAIDGVPFLPGVFDPSATAASAEPQAKAARERLSGQPHEAFAQGQRATLATMITAPAQADAVAAVSAKSDARSVGTAMYELMTTDLRADVAKIKVPVLLIGALAAVPEAYRAPVKQVYESQMAAIAQHRVVFDEKARHFVTVDDPTFFFREADAFIGSAP